MESTLSSSWSHSDPPFSCQGVALAHPDFLSPHNLVLWTEGSFPFGKSGFGVLANCSLCDTEATFSFQQGQCVQVFLLKPAPFFTLFAGLGSTNKSTISFLSPPTIWFLLCPCHPVFSSIFPLISNSVADLAETVFSLLLYYQATTGPWTLIFSGEPRG